MGTKIEYSINPLAYSVDCKNFTVDGVDVWEHNLKKELAYNNNQCSIGMDKLQVSMDKMLDRNNIESIKKTMQMHEEIFKHQVRELHRVYSVQKMLMDELKQHKFWTPMNNIGTNNPYVVKQQQQTTKISYGTELHVGSLREDLHVKERSGSCSGERNIKRQRDFDLERPACERDIFARGCDEGEAGPSSYTAFQSCKISNDDEDMEVDLSLSIGGRSSHVKKKKPYLLPLGFSGSSPIGKTREFNSSISFQSDNKVGDCSDPTTPMSSSSVTFDQEKRGPHWLSQGLKLK